MLRRIIACLTATVAATACLTVTAPQQANAVGGHVHQVWIKSDASNGTRQLRTYPYDDLNCTGRISVILRGGGKTTGFSFKSKKWDAVLKNNLGQRFRIPARHCSGFETNPRVTKWRVFLYKPKGR